MRPGPFGNPFAIRDGLIREEAILKFTEYFYSEKGRGLRELTLAKIPDGATLGCVCVPKPCHAEIIAGYLNWKRSQNGTVE